jgi:formylglycine-generating enzyme required for sulfatase activity
VRQCARWFIVLWLPAVASGSGKLTEAAPPVERLPQTVITNSIGMKLVLIRAGEFMMGSPDSDKDVANDEKPQHRVRITKPFYLGACEVTVGHFRQFVEETGRKTEDTPTSAGPVSWKKPGWQQTDEHPVVWVNWHEAVAFCDWLGRKEGRTYRLPTEAEWEYACRARSATRYTFGDDIGKLGEYAWFSPNSRGSPQPVGQKKANAWGLFDMHGNVWEWCADWYGKEYYATSPLDDPTGPPSGDLHVLRGNSWNYVPGLTRSAARGRSRPDHHNGISGFRLARTL